MSAAPATDARKRVGVFISGGGSNMLALADACATADFPAEIVAVISDQADAGGLVRAQSRGIRTFSFERRDFAGKADHESALLAALDGIRPDLLCLAGSIRPIPVAFIHLFTCRLPHTPPVLLPPFPCFHPHPPLLPLFPGLHTQQRALDAGMKIAGCTIHFVTEGMDEGPIVAQAAVPIAAGDTADTLAARVLTVEHRLYPLALKLVAEGTVRMEDGRAVTTPDASTAFSGQTLISCGL